MQVLGRGLLRAPSTSYLPAKGRATQRVGRPVRVAEKDAEKASIDATVESGLAQIAKQILENDPEAREGLKRYEEAVVRLEKAKAASEELERMFTEAQKGAIAQDEQEEELQKQQANERLADAEVAAAERRLRAAELELAGAQSAQMRWAGEANGGTERIESAKAAAVAALAGALAELPLVALTSSSSDAAGLSSALSFVSAVASCFLFGVTYRYAVRQDSWNTQLRGGVVAAFGLVRAAGAADVLQASASAGGAGPLSLDVIGPAALYAFESLIIFGFAATAVEAAFQNGIVKRFGDSAAPPPRQ